MSLPSRVKKTVKSLPLYEYLRPRLNQARYVHSRMSRPLRRTGLLDVLLGTLKVRVIRCPSAPAAMRSAEEFVELCRNVPLKPQTSRFFFYSLDPYTVPYWHPNRAFIGNVTIGYGRLLENGFANIENQVHAVSLSPQTPLLILQGLRVLSSRIRDLVDQDPDSCRRQLLLHAFAAMEHSPATSFHGALQRILFLNQNLWQCRHPLNGLGRLDQLLLPYYLQDRDAGRLNRSSATEMLKDFLVLLHHDFRMKSSTLPGDTGQIIVIGGALPDGEDACNELTELLLSAVGSLHQPDPKLLFRVSSRTPRRFIELAVDCLQERTGSPLFSNDDVVIPALVQFGFPQSDAQDYATAACWEPLIPGKSLDQGNIASLNFLKPFLAALEQMSHMDSEEDFSRLLGQCERELQAEVDRLLTALDAIRWQPAPFMSLFMDGCLSSGKDLSEGGAVYNNYGITTLAMGNLVDSLMNLRKLVIQDRSLRFDELKTAIRTNFTDGDDLVKSLRAQPIRYGSDNPDVVILTNRFARCASAAFRGRRNRFGGQFKLGLSSPEYLTGAIGFPATPDGRKAGDPFYVHISSNQASNSYTGLVRFSGQLEYKDNRFNGNVVDFILDPKLVDSFKDKFVDFLEGAIRSGFFQMQMTIVGSEMLRAAIKDPNKFPNLIVRVWGFSAYLRDLPMEYKQVVLKRTVRSEVAGW